MHISFSCDTPENQGMRSSAILNFIDAAEAQNLQINTFMMIRNGFSIAQFWKSPYQKDCVQLLYSLTKSFTGVGVGIACDMGLLRLEDSVISFFPDKLPAVICDNLQRLKVCHLLSMTCGIHDNTYAALYGQSDWLRAFLAQAFPHEPGTYYRYSTHSSHMLSAIVERQAGMRFHDFLNIHLFEPLGITKSTWESCQQGVTAGGMGLSLTTESIAKLGQMLLDKGLFQGRRILSEAYVTAMTSEQSDNRLLEKGRYRNGYGYQMQIGWDGNFHHPGGFGTLLSVYPKQQTVIAITSRIQNYEAVMDLIDKKLFSDDAPTDSAAYQRLQHRLSHMAYQKPLLLPKPIHAHPPAGQYAIDDNPHELESIAFEHTSPKSFRMNMTYSNRAASSLAFDFTKECSGYDVFVKDIQFHLQQYVSYAAWIHPNELQLKIIYIETPYVVTYRIVFDRLSVSIAFSMNSSLNLKDFLASGTKKATYSRLT